MKGRIGQLDGVRAIAVIAVFVTHAAAIGLLWMGVDLFFVLSGFLITGILIGAKQRQVAAYFGHFYERRARRILPPYMLLLVVTSVVFGLRWAQHGYLYLFLMNLLPAFHIDHPRSLSILWSLGVEEQFYLVWPFVIFFLSEEGIAWAAGAIIFAAPVFRLTCSHLFASPDPIWFLTPFRMDTLALGALIALAWRHHREKIVKYGAYGPVLTVFALGAWYVLLPRFHTGLTVAGNNSGWRNMLIFEDALVACGGIIVWALSGRYVGVLTWAPIRYVGRISYTLYLIHTAPLIFLEPYIPGRLPRGLLAGAITLLYAMISWHFYERPILLGKPKGSTRQQMEEEQRAAVAASD